MGNNRIKGIIVEIGGDTTKLTSALSAVNGEIKDTQKQLKDVEKLLKFDPNNTILLEQKQSLLTESIEKTAKKLEQLEDAQEQVNDAFKKGNIGKEQYMAFQREVEDTKKAIRNYRDELSAMNIEQESLETNTKRLQKLFAGTKSDLDDYADVLGTKLVRAIKSGTANSNDLKTAIEKIGKSALGGKTDIAKMVDALDKVDGNRALEKLVDDFKEAGKAAEDTADKIDEMADSINSGNLMEAADSVAALGDKITELGTQAVDTFSELNNATTKVSAYFGETGAAAEENAEIIQNVYNQGVGESMDSVANAVLMVKKNLKGLSETDITNLTKQALTLDELYGIDMNETLRGVNALMEQYGMSAQQAMDYIVKGTQNGLDKTNELGDNLSEYAGKFAQAGYSADEYFQLLQNGLDGGAYNLDKVNDAINEVTTRLADGTITDSIAMYSQNTQDLFAKWQTGGATQKQVIDSIVADIAGCTSQQDALNMAAKAFGTMAEDGNLKFITSLTSVGTTYDMVRGSAQGLFNDTTTPMQEMEANIRQLQATLIPLGEKLLELANTILPPLILAIQALCDFFGVLPEPVQNFIFILAALLTVFSALTPVIAAVSAANMALNISILPIIAVIAAVAAVIAIVIATYQNWGAISDWMKEKWTALKQACSVIFSAIGMGIKNTIDNIKTTVVNGFNKVITFITSIPSQALTWGKDMIMGIVNGIKSCIGAVGDAVTSVADKIKSILHFSVPDEGPLTDYETWMPDFMSGLAKGIEKSRGMVKDAIGGVASDMVLSPNVTANATQLSGTGHTDNFGTMLSSIETMIQSIQSGTGNNISIPVYLGGTLLDEVVVNAQNRQNLRSGGR